VGATRAWSGSAGVLAHRRGDDRIGGLLGAVGAQDSELLLRFVAVRRPIVELEEGDHFDAPFRVGEDAVQERLDVGGLFGFGDAFFAAVGGRLAVLGEEDRLVWGARFG